MNMITSSLLIALLTGAFAFWTLSFMLDDQIAMSQCMRHHAYSSCHYSLYR